MELYINSTGIISAAGSNTSEDFLIEPQTGQTDCLYAAEPGYTGLIPPMQLRRMSKAVRMGIAASKNCMQQLGIEKPDAISVGTALGCLQDTETFLRKMIEQDEQMLTPTSFIQSTHNTVAGQIALLSGCYGHNLTFVHRGHSFEHALINTRLYLDSHPGEKVLLGGIDEMTETSLKALKLARVYRNEKSRPADILHTSAAGSIAGEGAAFFIAGDQPLSSNHLCIKDLVVFATKDNAVALRKLNDFCLRNKLSEENIDLVLLGINGDVRSEAFYKELREKIFKNNSQAAFKHLCGDYGTASSFALGILMHAIADNSFPPVAILNKKPGELRSVLLVSNYIHYYSCWYITIP